LGDRRNSSTGLSPAFGKVDRIYGEDGNDIIYGGNEDESVLKKNQNCERGRCAPPLTIWVLICFDKSG
jgi:hypothetical protein